MLDFGLWTVPLSYFSSAKGSISNLFYLLELSICTHVYGIQLLFGVIILHVWVEVGVCTLLLLMVTAIAGPLCAAWSVTLCSSHMHHLCEGKGLQLGVRLVFQSSFDGATQPWSFVLCEVESVDVLSLACHEKWLYTYLGYLLWWLSVAVTVLVAQCYNGSLVYCCPASYTSILMRGCCGHYMQHKTTSPSLQCETSQFPNMLCLGSLYACCACARMARGNVLYQHSPTKWCLSCSRGVI